MEKLETNGVLLPSAKLEAGAPNSPDEITPLQQNEDPIIIERESPTKPDTERANWGSRTTFVVSMLGCMIGIGNLWRFSYLCYDNGGGAFVVCYAIAIFTAGIPMSFTEIGLGQYFSESAITIWKISPICKGIGIAGPIVTFYWICYAMVLFAWSLMYFCLSFNEVLPWSSCENWWSSKFCVSDRKNLECFEEGNQTYCYMNNSTVLRSSLTDPVREFWENRLLQKTSGIHDLGGFQKELVLYLLCAYVIIYFCLFKGILWAKKIVYVTALFPYALIIVMLVRGVTLPGAVNGLKYFLLPDFRKLLDYQVWITAFSQVFYSFCIAFGILTPMGSYNKFHHNCYRDSILVVGMGALWSIIAGFAVFSVVGFMALEQQKPVDEVAASGAGLVFLVYPTAILQMSYPHFWNVLFFLMVQMVVLDTIFCSYEAVITSITDVWPKYLRKSTELTALVFCIVGFLAGLIFVTKGGIYWFELFDYHAASGISIMTIAFCECIAIAYIYGIDRFWDNLQEMIGYYPSFFWKFCIKYITPSITLIILSFNVIKWNPVKYMDYEYPMWAHAIGWCLSISSIAFIPLNALYLIWTTPTDSDGILKKIQRLSTYETKSIQQTINLLPDN